MRLLRFDVNFPEGRFILADILLHDVNNNRQNHIVLRSKADGNFEEIDTQ